MRGLPAVNGGSSSAAAQTRDVAQAGTSLSKLEAIVRQHREEASTQAAAAEKASSQLAALQEEHNSRCTHWMAEKDELNGLIGSLRAEIAAREEDLGSLRAAHTAQCRQADRARQLEADLAAANADRDDLNGLIGSLQAEVAALQKDMGGLREAKRDRQQAAQKAQRQLEADLAAAHAERDDLRGKLAELEGRLAEGSPQQTSAAAPATPEKQSAAAKKVPEQGEPDLAAELAAAKKAAQKAENLVLELQAQLSASQEASRAAEEKLQAASAEAQAVHNRLEAEVAALRAAGTVAAAAAVAATPQKEKRRGLFSRRSSKQLETPRGDIARPGSAGSVSLPESTERAALAEEIASLTAEKTRCAFV